MASQKTEVKLLNGINHKLDQLVGLNAIQGKDEAKQIQILSALGFKSIFIGQLLGISSDAVRQRKSYRRRKSRTKETA